MRPEVLDKTVKAVKIEQTTAPAFQILIDAIYDTKSIEDRLKGKSVKEVFDVVNLIEQYQIAQLKEPIEELLADYPVADDTVLDVAEEAMEYATVFQKEAQRLLLNCAKFLKPKLKDADAIFTYAAENNNQKEVFAALLALMKDIAPMTKCPNCGYENCKNGEPVEDGELRVGLIVTANEASGGWYNPYRGTGKVTSITSTAIYVESITPGPVEKFGTDYEKISSNGKPRGFLFSCK